MFATGEGILMQMDGITHDGLQEVFATNLFGHFLLVSHWIYLAFWSNPHRQYKAMFPSGFCRESKSCLLFTLDEINIGDTGSVCHLATMLIKY